MFNIIIVNEIRLRAISYLMLCRSNLESFCFQPKIEPYPQRLPQNTDPPPLTKQSKKPVTTLYPMLIFERT